jgi:hypothetical protein
LVLTGAFQTADIALSYVSKWAIVTISSSVVIWTCTGSQRWKHVAAASCDNVTNFPLASCRPSVSPPNRIAWTTHASALHAIDAHPFPKATTIAIVKPSPNIVLLPQINSPRPNQLAVSALLHNISCPRTMIGSERPSSVRAVEIEILPKGPQLVANTYDAHKHVLLCISALLSAVSSE